MFWRNFWLEKARQIWISSIDSTAFRGVPKLRALRLDNNNLKTIDRGLFASLTSLTELHLQVQPPLLFIYVLYSFIFHHATPRVLTKFLTTMLLWGFAAYCLFTFCFDLVSLQYLCAFCSDEILFWNHLFEIQCKTSVTELLYVGNCVSALIFKPRVESSGKAGKPNKYSTIL